MFGFGRRRGGEEAIHRLHGAVVAASRAPELYERGDLPDTVEGRFEALTLHVLLVMRRLNQLPPPAAEVAQELIDSVFAHLEIAMRESGVGDFGVPKRMKKLARAFYDRTITYDRALDAGDAGALAAAVAARVEAARVPPLPFALYLLASERELASCDLDGILAGPPFALASAAGAQAAAS